MATEKKAPAEKVAKGKGEGEVMVEALMRIRMGREKSEDGKPGRAIYVEEGEEYPMRIDEAEKAEERGIVKILAGRKAREAAKAE